MSLVLSIDVGTTNVKASLVNQSGTLLHVARRENPILREDNGAARHNPEILFDNVVSAAKEAIAGRQHEVSLIVTSAYQYGLVILDKDLNPISEMSTLLDSRAAKTFAEFLQTHVPQELYEVTGCPSFTQSILPRLYYFKEHKPEYLEKGHYFLSSKAWMLYKLTGEIITEASTESASMLLDVHNAEWCQDSLDIVGLSKDNLPEIVEPLGNAFPIRNEIALRLEVSPEVKVIPGIYDGGSTCLGLNGYHQNSAVSNIGTSGMLRMVSDKIALDYTGSMRLQPFYFMDGKYLIGGAVNNASLPLRWMKENLFELDYQEIDRLAHNSPVGSKNLFFLPYLTGERDIKIGSISSGAFMGLKEFHTRADFIRSILEGVAYSINMIKEGIVASGIEIQKVHIGGGGVRRADIWVDILANVLDLELVRSRNEEPCLVGNAMLGYVYLGVFEDIKEAELVCCSDGYKVTPDHEKSLRYSEFFQFYKKLYDQFTDIYAQHSDFANRIREMYTLETEKNVVIADC